MGKGEGRRGGGKISRCVRVGIERDRSAQVWRCQQNEQQTYGAENLSRPAVPWARRRSARWPPQSRHAQELACHRFPSRSAPQQYCAGTFQFCPHHVPSYPHLFGHGDAQDLLAAHCRIVLPSAVPARDEHIPSRIGSYQPMHAESVVALHQNNVSPPQSRHRNGFHMNHLAIADGRKHTGSARFKANPEPGPQAFNGYGFKLLRLRTVAGTRLIKRLGKGTPSEPAALGQ